MGRRILAMLISVALVLGVNNSPSIYVHASNDINAIEEEADTEIVEESVDEEETELEDEETPAEIDEESVDEEETELEDEETPAEIDEEPADEEEAELEEEAPAPAPLSVNKQIGDLNICIDAPEGVFPAGTYAVITELTSAGVISSIEDAVASQLSDSQTITNIRAFDITMYDADGNEVQPDTDKGVVNVSIKNINTVEAITNPDKDMEVFHVEDSLNAASAVDTTVLAGEVCFEAEHFSSYAVVSIEDHEADPTKVINPEDLVESVSVTLNGKELDKSGANKISKDDKLRVVYKFKSPIVISKDGTINKNINGTYVKAGDSYEIPGIPKELTNPSGYSLSVENGGKKLGEITIDKDGNAKFVIDNSSSDKFITATDAEAGKDLTLNADVLNDSSKDSYELSFGGNTYKIRINEFEPKEPEVAKTVSDIDSDGNVTWTVTVTNAAKPINYEEGYSFVDTLGKGHTYVDGSFNSAVASITPTISFDKRTISWTCEDNTANKKITFTYKTHVDFVALTKDKNVNDTVKTKVSNSVKVTSPKGDDYDALEVTKPAEKEVSKTVEKWVDKVCTKEVDASGVSEWKIVIKNNEFDLKNVVLHDKISVDSGEKITISDVNVDSSVTGTDVTSTYKNSLDYKFDTMSGNAVYTITYEAKIEDFENYLKENHNVPTNKAWIEYEYDPGTGDGFAKVKGPDISAKFTGSGVISKAAIQKEAIKAYPENHTLEWKVKVNNNKQALTKVTVTEAIPSDQEYVEIKNVEINGTDASGKYTINDSDKNNVIVDFGDNITGNTASFTIITKLTDAENGIWGSNASREYSNTATLKSYGNADVSDSATQKFTSTVIEKNAANYDYSTHLIHYTITTNQNKMEMNNVVVTDPLDARLEYVEGSYTGAGTASYDTSNNTVTFAFANITDTTVIEFDAKVRDGATFENNGSFSIENEAAITSMEYPEETKVKTKTDINNKVIGKQGKRNKEVVDYTVELNVAGQDLYRSGIGEVVIQDTIGASMVLDESTVKLYEATVNPDGSLHQASAIDGITIRVDRSNPKTVLEVVVPNDGGGKSYILAYTAKMLNKKANDFGNDVILKGYGDGAKNKSNVQYNASDFASVSFDNYVYYISGLKDENDNDLVLAGAHFELLDPSQDNKVVDEADSDTDGEIMFVGVLEENHDYILKETKAPDGYEIPEALKDGIAVFTKGKGYGVADAEKENHIIYNSKPSRLLNFSLLDGKDKSTDMTKKADDPNPPKIAVFKGGVKVWDSDSGTPFKAIYGTEYEVKETKTPFGYKGDSVTGYKFKIEEGHGELKITDGLSENVKLDGDKITLFDFPLESMAIEVNDISKDYGMYLKGAKFAIKKGSETVREWSSDGGFKEIELPEGDYELVRTDEPSGFKAVTKKLKLSIKPDALSGELKLEITENDGDIEVEDNKIIVPEENDETKKKALSGLSDEEKAKLALPAEISELSLTPFMFKGGAASSLSGAPEWSGTDLTEAKLSPQVQYLLTVTDKSGKKLTKIATINEKGELVVSDYIPPKKAAAPTKGSSGSSSSSSGSDDDDDKAAQKKEAPKEENKLVEDSKTVTTVKTKPRYVKRSQDRFRLAKTGGFMGTIAGYGAGYGLVIAGALMVICNKKKRK